MYYAAPLQSDRGRITESCNEVMFLAQFVYCLVCLSVFSRITDTAMDGLDKMFRKGSHWNKKRLQYSLATALGLWGQWRWGLMGSATIGRHWLVSLCFAYLFSCL